LSRCDWLPAQPPGRGLPAATRSQEERLQRPTIGFAYRLLEGLGIGDRRSEIGDWGLEIGDSLGSATLKDDGIDKWCYGKSLEQEEELPFPRLQKR